MAVPNYPTAPIDGEQYRDPLTGIEWVWKAIAPSGKWGKLEPTGTGGGLAQAYISSAVPPVDNSLPWFDTTDYTWNIWAGTAWMAVTSNPGEASSAVAAGDGITITTVGAVSTVSLTPPYLSPAFSAFSISGPTAYANGNHIEVGTPFNSSQTFSWTASNPDNIKPETISIVDLTGLVTLYTAGANDSSQTVTGLGAPMTPAGKTFRITARNTKEVDFSRDLVLNGTYPWFYGKVTTGTRPTPNAALAISGIKVVASGSGTLTIPFNSGSGDYLWFAVPNTYAVKTAWAAGLLDAGTIAGEVFAGGNLFPAPTNASATTALWSNVSYKIYVSNYQVAIASLQVS